MTEQDPAEASAEGNQSSAVSGFVQGLLADPASSDIPNPPFPPNLTGPELRHLETFDEMDLTVFSNAQWQRLQESHAEAVRVHWPDGHYTDGLDQHIADLAAMFAWAPDCHIHKHPVRIAKNNFTCVLGVIAGTFSQLMPDGKRGLIQPTGKSFSLNMATIGVWNSRGVMDEEFLYWDNQTLYTQIGVPQ